MLIGGAAHQQFVNNWTVVAVTSQESQAPAYLPFPEVLLNLRSRCCPFCLLALGKHHHFARRRDCILFILICFCCLAESQTLDSDRSTPHEHHSIFSTKHHDTRISSVSSSPQFRKHNTQVWRGRSFSLVLEHVETPP